HAGNVLLLGQRVLRRQLVSGLENPLVYGLFDGVVDVSPERPAGLHMGPPGLSEAEQLGGCERGVERVDVSRLAGSVLVVEFGRASNDVGFWLVSLLHGVLLGRCVDLNMDCSYNGPLLQQSTVCAYYRSQHRMRNGGD